MPPDPSTQYRFFHAAGASESPKLPLFALDLCLYPPLPQALSVLVPKNQARLPLNASNYCASIIYPVMAMASQKRLQNMM
jgi:hypothetical protein